MADLKTSLPSEYYKKHLEQDVRPDGRSLGENRPIVLNLGSIETADGSALVKIGNTSVLCGITGQISEPKPEHPEEGFINISVELPAMSSHLFRGVTNPEQAQIATHFITELLTCSGCVDLASLCIEKTKHAWELLCDLVCLEYDGNLLDACTLAFIAALSNTALPEVALNEDTGLPETSSNKRPLKVHAYPISTTFSTIDNIVIVDPNQGEESLSDGKLTVVTKDEHTMCMVYKPGGSALTDETMNTCISHAFERRGQVMRLLAKTKEAIKVSR